MKTAETYARASFFIKTIKHTEKNTPMLTLKVGQKSYNYHDIPVS